MITAKAKEKARVLIFWEKHGLEATIDAFPAKRSTLFLWKKKWIKGNKKIEALNEKKRIPQTKRKRLWPLPIIQEIKRIRGFGPRELDDGHPNLGSDKIYPLLLSFCLINNLQCPKIITINRIIKDLGGLRITPQRISHFGKTKETKKKKILRKPKDFEAKYPGHLVSLDTIEIIINGIRRYIITFEDIYTRFKIGRASCRERV